MSKQVVNTGLRSRLPVRAAATLYGIMSRRRRWQLVGTMCLMLLGAVAELLTIGAVLPSSRT
jgi:hypothetical protein